MNIRTATRVCHECAFRYDVMTFPVSFVGGVRKPGIELMEHILYEEDPPPGTKAFCSECGCEEYYEIMPSPLPIGLGGEAGVGKHFPYFDRGLGRHIHDAGHRKRVCAKMGVEPTEGAEMHIERHYRRYDEKRMGDIKKYHDLLDYYASQEDTAKALIQMEDKVAVRAKEAMDGTAKAITGYDTDNIIDQSVATGG